MTGIKMSHVPYKGSAPALNDVVAGHIPCCSATSSPALQLVRDGKVRALGVTRPARAGGAGIPPLAEAGVPGYEASPGR